MMNSTLEQDAERFYREFRNKLNTVFLYMLNNCNFECKHCYMGEKINFDRLSFNEIKSILTQTFELGAKHIIFLGGEPTLHPDILKAIRFAKKIGFNKICVDTNGSFPIKFLDDSNFKLIDVLSFSLDGYNKELHDNIRIKGSFDEIIKKIIFSKEKGFFVRVTTTINSINYSSVLNLIDLLESLNVDELNFHIITNNGNVRKNKYLLLPPHLWIDCYKKIKNYSQKNKIRMKLRPPIRYCNYREFNSKHANCCRCETLLRKRILIYPNKKVYSCSILGGSKYNIAEFRKNKFIWIDGPFNEIKFFNIDKLNSKKHICPVISSKGSLHYMPHSRNLVPLCISYKPDLK